MRPKLVLFGDSLTEESFCNSGWGALLAHQFSRAADVVLRGYSGYNTRCALKVMENAMDCICGEGCEAPAAVVVFFGANDAALADRSSRLQHVPIPEYQANLGAICAYLKEKWPSTQIILITPPPIDEDARLKNAYAEDFSGLPERTNESASAYACACIAFANESGFPVIDLWSRMQQVSEWKKTILRDGLHLLSLGNRMLFEEVVKKLKEEGMSLESWPVDAPLLCNIGPHGPSSAFEDFED